MLGAGWHTGPDSNQLFGGVGKDVPLKTQSCRGDLWVSSKGEKEKVTGREQENAAQKNI